MATALTEEDTRAANSIRVMWRIASVVIVMRAPHPAC